MPSDALELRLSDGTETLTGGSGNDLLAVQDIHTGLTMILEAGDGHDLVIGGRASFERLFGGAGNDVLLGSRTGIPLEPIAASGFFDLALLFADEGQLDVLDGGAGDDLIVLGIEDVGRGGLGNDLFDTRFSLGRTTAHGGDGIDTLRLRLSAADSYVREPALLYDQILTLAALPGGVAASGIEVLQLANARAPGSLADLTHVLGSGDQMFMPDTVLASGGFFDIRPLIIDYASDGAVPDEGFVVRQDLALSFDSGVQVQIAGQAAFFVSYGAGFDTRFGTVSLSYASTAFHMRVSYALAPDIGAALAPEVNAGQTLRLGGTVQDTVLSLSSLHAGFTKVSGVFVETVAAGITTTALLPDTLDLRGASGLTRGATVEGNLAANIIHGTALADIVSGGDGADTLRGHTGNDTLSGDAGNDLIQGDRGVDRIYGGLGDDDLSGGDGSDWLWGGDGADTLWGGAFRDRLNGGNDADLLFGESGDDSLYGGLGDDTLDGGSQNDRLLGSTGRDALFGGDGTDTLDGGASADRLFGGDGDDILLGGTGNDTLSGGTGNDSLTGGAGADLFVFAASPGAVPDRTVFTDFTIGPGGDRLILEGAAHGLSASALRALMVAEGTDTVLTLHGRQLVFAGIGPEAFAPGDGWLATLI